MRWICVLAVVLAVSVPAGACAAPKSVMQDNALLLRSGPVERDRALDEMRALGVDVVRVLVVWRDIAPRPRGLVRPSHQEPDAGKLASLVGLREAARARHLRLLVTLTGPGPAWASGCSGSIAQRQLCRPDPQAFARFVGSVGRALPQQRLWSVWNEPNAGVWLTPQRSRGHLVSPGLYRRLVFSAVGALDRSGHRGDTVLVGETAPIGHTGGPEATRPTAPGAFIRALLCGLRAGRCPPLPGSGFAHHMYPAAARPVPCAASAPGEFGATGLRGLQRLLRLAAAHGLTRRRLPLWITESGVQTAPPDRLFGVSLGEQARDINELEWLATEAHAASVAQYLLVDERRLDGFQSGLRFVDGRAKPALAAYRLPIWVVRTHGGVRMWARARLNARSPVVAVLEHRTHGAWHVVATRTLPSGGGLFALSVRGGWRGRWRVRANGHVSRQATAARPCRPR